MTKQSLEALLAQTIRLATILFILKRRHGFLHCIKDFDILRHA
jgi:hypothetical protein